MHDATRRRQALVIVNPTAGRRRRAFFDAALAELERRGCGVVVRATERPLHAETLAREAVRPGCDVVVAAGGDGTMNEVVNGLAETDLPLGLIPLGTSNVLAREIGLRGGPREAARVIVEGRELPARVGLANNRRFVMMAGVGFDARVVAAVSSREKRALGRWAYVLEALRDWRRRSAPSFTFRIDGRVHTATAIVAANGRHYGGPFIIAGEADLVRASFEVVAVERPGRAALLRAGLALLFGRMGRSRGVRVVRAAEIVVDAPAGEPVQADGDLVTTTPVRITVAPGPQVILAP